MTSGDAWRPGVTSKKRASFHRNILRLSTCWPSLNDSPVTWRVPPNFWKRLSHWSRTTPTRKRCWAKTCSTRASVRRPFNTGRKAVEADPNNSEALYNLAQNLQKAGRPEAQLYMNRFQALESNRHLTDRVQQLGNFGLEAANARNWPQAVEDMKEALLICGGCPQGGQLHRNLGLIYCRQGDIESGKRELRLALKLNPNDGDALKAIETLEEAPNRQSVAR